MDEVLRAFAIRDGSECEACWHLLLLRERKAVFINKCCEMLRVTKVHCTLTP